MKNQLKKIMFSVFVSVFVLFGYSMAFASMTITPTSPQAPNTSISVTCSSPDAYAVIIYNSLGNYVSFKTCPTTTLTSVTAGDFSLVEADANFQISQTLTQMQGSSSYRSLSSYTFSNPVIPPVVTGGVHFLGATALTGTGSLTNQLTASVGTTSGSLLPVLAVVAGIIFAMIGLNYIFGLMREVDKNKKAK